MDRESELDFVRRLRAGDADAFDVVYEMFNARLFTFLARLMRSRERAEDLLEDTWLRLVTHADRLQPDTRLAPWLFTVAGESKRRLRRCRSRTGKCCSSSRSKASISPKRRTSAASAGRRFVNGSNAHATCSRAGWTYQRVASAACFVR